ncbi:GNAT family N-acetyltransferase [Brevibacillus centrosporus]|uniref:GNAT family N-acetyltransferase n=1 Tax=Brevibacillus centrosporus TaxID=54910 RepID=UPI002E1D3BF7|nr:GNAT family N-acetyltransferase [Brevibacillus centrosporus]
MKLTVMKLPDAIEIVSWKYPEPYSFYNFEDTQELMDELLDGTYFSVRDSRNQLIGFFCFGKNAQVPAGFAAGLYVGENVCDIGLGMKPELTGLGLGAAFMKRGMEFAVKHYAPSQLRLSVAAFNKRAIRLYEKMGFQEVGSFPSKETVFLVMNVEL